LTLSFGQLLLQPLAEVAQQRPLIELFGDIVFSALRVELSRDIQIETAQATRVIDCATTGHRDQEALRVRDVLTRG
jgi:hypothetical protein